MALHIIEDPLNQGAAGVIADRELYTDAGSTKLLEPGDEGAAFLLASGPGKAIDASFVAALRLEVDGNGKVKQRAAGNDKELHAGATKHEATPPVDDGTLADPIVAAGASSLDGLSKTKLREIAKEQQVVGYSGMNEDELRAALAEGGANFAGGPVVD